MVRDCTADASLHLQLERRKVESEASHEIKAPKLQPRESAQAVAPACLQPRWPEQRGAAGPLSICLKGDKQTGWRHSRSPVAALGLIQAPFQELTTHSPWDVLGLSAASIQ